MATQTGSVLWFVFTTVGFIVVLGFCIAEAANAPRHRPLLRGHLHLPHRHHRP